MQESIGINLGGMAFNVEKRAYLLLKTYLEKVEKQLGGSLTSQEQLNEIESRIAGLFITLDIDPRQVITFAQVENIITSIDPLWMREENLKGAATGIETGGYKQFKQLSRLPSKGVIAGVCSGLAAHYNLSLFFLRVLFLIGLFTGLSIIIYLLLWVFIPRELSIIQPDLNPYTYGKLPFSSLRAKNRPSPTIKFVPFTIGLLLVLLSVALMFAIGETAAYWSDLVFNFSSFTTNPYRSSVVLAGILLLAGVPLLMLLYLGVNMMLGWNRWGKTIGTIGLMLWLTGILLFTFNGVRLFGTFQSFYSGKDISVLEPLHGDTLYIRAGNVLASTWVQEEKAMTPGKGVIVSARGGHLWFKGIPSVKVILGKPSTELTIIRKGRGLTIDDARQNAQMTDYSWHMRDSTLTLDMLYTLNRAGKFGFQELLVELHVAEGVSVNIDTLLKDLVTVEHYSRGR